MFESQDVAPNEGWQTIRLAEAPVEAAEVLRSRVALIVGQRFSRERQVVYAGLDGTKNFFDSTLVDASLGHGSVVLQLRVGVKPQEYARPEFRGRRDLRPAARPLSPSSFLCSSVKWTPKP